jgi:hypothetical protein
LSPPPPVNDLPTPPLHLPSRATADTNVQSTPSQQSSSPSSQPHRKLKSPLLAQSNTLLNWLVPTQARVIEGSASVPTIQLSARSSVLSPALHSPRPSSIQHTQNASPTSTRAIAEDTTVNIRESTWYKLARQLRHFQGCTHEEHSEYARLHVAHHQRDNVHSACSSLPQVTSLLRGDYVGGTPLPDVLGSPKLMKAVDLPAGLDCAGAFEGASAKAFPEDVGTPDEQLPRSLCLGQHHHSSAKGRAAKTTYDVDSLCCFPSSLGFARQGINWFPRSHAFLNLSQDIHFSLPASAYTPSGEIRTLHTPLHKIPHYCFGTAVGMESLAIFIFFPELRTDNQYAHSNYLSNNDQVLWYDKVLLPALTRTIPDANRLQHYPVSAQVARLDATALGAETFARKETAREQLLKYTLQPQELDMLWTHLREHIAGNTALGRFSNATLFAHSKNTKLEYMADTLSGVYASWQRSWAKVADPQFYSRDRTFVDIGKQVTSEDSALPYDVIPEACKAEVFLWKQCCLQAYTRTRIKRLPNGKAARGSARVTTYPWATMRDTVGQTLFAVPQGQENMDGLVYSQFYGLIKTPFDTSKAYVFSNEALENLALDPGYVRSLQQQGGGVTYSRAVCEFAYLHGKKRAHANLVDNQWRSYGIREEHRVSLTLMDAVDAQWTQWDLYDDSIDNARPPLPYYVVPTKVLLGFLSAQINKFCFLFEYTLAHTARTYSLPETVMMVVALRALRFCYGSNMLMRESLLYKNRWEKTNGLRTVVKEGLGMQETMEQCGLGWFLPKINWATLRFAPPHGENMLVGNMLVHKEYKRRWRAVKDLRDVFVRFNQASGWYSQYHLEQHPQWCDKWLEYLHALNLEQFDADVWKAMLAANKRAPELSPALVEGDGRIAYCHKGMKDIFRVHGVASGPYLVTGNKKRFAQVGDILNFLFGWDDKEDRSSWASKPYRLILQKSFEMIEGRLGRQRALQWLREFHHLVRLTHWILPYPSKLALISSSKTSEKQGLTRRMIWFSAIYSPASIPKQPPQPSSNLNPNPATLYRAFARARPTEDLKKPWRTRDLLNASRRAGIGIVGIDAVLDHWVVGLRSVGYSGFEAVWERGRVPILAMREQIANKSLDELDEQMVMFTQENEDVAPLAAIPLRAPLAVPAIEPRTRRRSIGDFFCEAGARSSCETTMLPMPDSSSSSYRPSTYNS